MEGDNNLVYGACNRNYAAQIGMYVLDGCGEFALDSAGSRYCEACGCDKNFHLVIASNRTTTTSVNNLGAKPNTNMSTRINGGRIRLSINENSVLTLVRDEDGDDDDDDQVEVNGPEIVDDMSTATSGTKSKKNKKKNKK